jgi:aspartate kinase
MTRVMKFGGSSVADAACMRQVATLVSGELANAPLVVLSAMGKTTDALLRAAHASAAGDRDEAMRELGDLEARHRIAAVELFDGALPPELELEIAGHFRELERFVNGVTLLGELSPRSLDAIAARGELLSTSIFGAYLAHTGVASRWLDARTVMRTDANFGCAQPDTASIKSQSREHVAPWLGADRAVVTQGYIGASADGTTTTLGRGGSDYSAALFSAALGADECQIWTDVEGVYTCDPRVVAAAMPIAELSFAEAAELAAFGAKVLHPSTIQPAVEARIPVTVRHTQRPQGRFTTIRERTAGTRPVTALASRGPVTIVTVTSTRMLAASGFLARLFEVFGRLGVSVDLVATAEVSVSLTVENDAPLDALERELGHFAVVEFSRDRALVALVGERLKHTPGIGAKVFRALEDINVEMISMGANEINLSLVVARSQEREVVRRLHAALFEP